MELNDLTYKLKGCILKVHANPGPGFLESVYKTALAYELSQSDLNARVQVGLPENYGSVKLELGLGLAILVEEQLIIEIKSVDTLHDVHKKQLFT